MSTPAETRPSSRVRRILSLPARPAYGPVRVYDAEGRLVREIPVEVVRATAERRRKAAQAQRPAPPVLKPSAPRPDVPRVRNRERVRSWFQNNT